jgi:fructose-bisphosphate aldolase class I
MTRAEITVNTAGLEDTATALVARGKGILAADEPAGVISRRFAALGLVSTADTRRAYRELFISTPGIGQFIGGVILHEETMFQHDSAGAPLVDVVLRQGIAPGVSIDRGTRALHGSPGEHLTEGLDTLPDRLDEFAALGARFAKWRAAFSLSSTLPSPACLRANAIAIGRYAAICQERHMVPAVELALASDGAHTIERCEEAFGQVLRAVFDEMHARRILLEGMVLQPDMILPGAACPKPSTAVEIAAATLRCLRRHVPAAVPVVVFRSGGQDHARATLHLGAINHQTIRKPWVLSFAFGRALQEEALELWRGMEANRISAQQAFYHRARCISAAAVGRFPSAIERTAAAG